MATPPKLNPPTQRKSALLLCYWLYDEMPEPCQIEILVLCEPVATPAGGFDFVVKYEARAHEFDPKENAFRLRLVHQFAVAANAKAVIATGSDPLYSVYCNDLGLESDLKSKLPTLAAVYDSITLKVATPAALISLTSPRL